MVGQYEKKFLLQFRSRVIFLLCSNVSDRLESYFSVRHGFICIWQLNFVINLQYLIRETYNTSKSTYIFSISNHSISI
jgi:hypothetical protein